MQQAAQAAPSPNFSIVKELDTYIQAESSKQRPISAKIASLVKALLSYFDRQLPLLDSDSKVKFTTEVSGNFDNLKSLSAKLFGFAAKDANEKSVEPKTQEVEPPCFQRLLHSQIKWKFGQTFLPSFYFQVHPENNLLQILQLMPAFLEMNKQLASMQLFVKPVKGTEPAYIPRDSWAKSPIEDPILEYRTTLSTRLMTFLTEQFNGVLPPESAEYFKALSFIEKEILPIPLVALEKEEIVKLLTTTNALLYPKRNGMYRFTREIIWDGTRVPDNEKGVNYIEKQLAKYSSKEEMGTWKSQTKEKIHKLFFENKKLTSLASMTLPDILDEKDLQVLSHIAHVTCPAEELKERLNSFAAEFLAKATTCKDPYELAAFCHHHISNLHPFVDANGRTARCVMNIVLAQAGVKPLIIDNDENYTKALRANDVAVFTKYLKSLILQQKVVPQFVQDGLDDIRKINSQR